ncbi:MAG TPA: translational GTPase TypA [Bacillales bacterium]|nr:translational GTPase TypA [Bacillales bacterium]
MTELRQDLRNIAIIAHVDHGKTTLVDQLLRQSGTFRENEHVDDRAMDTNELERERGITILAKNTAINYQDKRINILDTPGHADFGGEVERIMNLVDGVLLVVDAFEGCMPQTRFVLKKAFEQNLTPIVVVNKIDRPNARPDEVVDEVLDLFIELGADEEQLDFPVVYTSAINGTASLDAEEQGDDMAPLFELMIDNVPAPVDNSEEPLQFQVALLDYSEFLGRIGIGRVFRGNIAVGQQVAVSKLDGTVKQFRVTKLYGFIGLKKIEIQEASAGDIVAVTGMEDITVGETICPADHVDPLPVLRIDEPTLQMTFVTNTSPFAGREGKFITSRKIEERLQTEMKRDVSLRVEATDSPDAWIVSGRGELHLSILIENMRREGYELAVSKPEVIIREVDGVSSEPFEHVDINVPDDHTGTIMEALGERKAEMLNMEQTEGSQVHLEFLVPSRGLIGYLRDFLTQTRGYGILNHSFDSYHPVIHESLGGRRQGVLVSMENGKATPYSLFQLEDRGTMFVEPGTEIYEGMIVGEHNRDNDIAVNVTKAKHATNVRSATKDNTVVLKKPRTLSLEDALTYINDDELCEVTPETIRLRKKILNKSEREKAEKRKKTVTR